MTALTNLVIILHLAIAGPQGAGVERRAEQARAALADEDFDTAARLYAELVKTAPGNAGLRMNYGIAQLARRQYASAVEQFQIVVKQEPKFAAAWRMLGDCYGKLGEKGKALDALKKAADMEPRNVETSLDYATALRAAGRHADASNEFWKVIQLDQQSVLAWHGLALTNAVLAKSEKDPAKRQEFRARAEKALEQLDGLAGPKEDGLLREAEKAVEELRESKP